MLLAAVFIAERYHQPQDALTVTVRTADPKNLPPVTTAQTVTAITTTETTTETVTTEPVRDLNLAEAADLLRVDGIGETLAADIIAHRGEIGGYVRRSQLTEVSGIGETLMERIMQEFEINGELPPETTAPAEEQTEYTAASETTEKAPPVPKDLNEIGREELLAVPEMTEELADRILEFRAHAGKMVSVYELTVLKGIDREWIRRVLKPYFYIEGDIYAAD